MRKEAPVSAPAREEARRPSPTTITYAPRGEMAGGLAVPLTGSVFTLLIFLYGALIAAVTMAQPFWLAELLRGEALPLLGLF